MRDHGDGRREGKVASYHMGDYTSPDTPAQAAMATLVRRDPASGDPDITQHFVKRLRTRTGPSLSCGVQQGKVDATFIRC